MKEQKVFEVGDVVEDEYGECGIVTYKDGDGDPTILYPWVENCDPRDPIYHTVDWFYVKVIHYMYKGAPSPMLYKYQ